MKILVSDPIAERGVEILRASPGADVVVKTGLDAEELKKEIADADALVIRSGTQVTREVIEAASKLRVIGRAGVGVDNVDLPAATERGVVVMNTPGGNTISTAEHTFSLMLALARRIPEADASMKAGRWDRKTLKGVELNGKVLGIIGLGRVGTEVAKRARAFGMAVLGYDPLLSPRRAQEMDVEPASLDAIWERADFITMHTPLNDETRSLIRAETLQRMKKGVRIVNCARGGIVNEDDLADAIRAGKVAGAAIDVYPKEPPEETPLRGLDRVILTPHLGASTVEAQENVGIEIAEQVVEALTTGTLRNSVNMPSVDAQTLQVLQPYLSLGAKIGALLGQLGARSVSRIEVCYAGRIADLTVDPATRAILAAFLRPSAGEEVNVVNAPLVASHMGIEVQETRSTTARESPDSIRVAASGEGWEASAEGTFFGSPANPRIVRINEYPVEAVPEGTLLVAFNRDRPGLVGFLGSVMGRHGVNIAQMTFGRREAGGDAISVLNLDTAPGAEALAEIRANEHIEEAFLVRL